MSADGGGAWTSLRTYTVADVYGSESIDIIAYKASNTRIRFICTAAGTKHFRVDTVQIAYERRRVVIMQ